MYERSAMPTSHRRPAPTRHNRRRPRLVRRVALGATLIAIVMPIGPAAYAKGPGGGGSGGGKHVSAGPSVVIKTPAAGTATTGSVTASGTASDSTSLKEVDVQVDSTGWQVASGTTSWSLPLGSNLPAGTHTLYARATDTSGLTTTTSESFTVDPAPAAPTVVISSPASGSSVQGTVTVAGTASDNTGVASVAVQVNGGAWQTASGTTSWTFSWDTTAVSNGAATLTARVTDTGGSTGTATTSVSVNNPVPDTTPPSIIITAPAAGSTQSGTVSVTGTAGDNVALSSVQVQVDGGTWQPANGTASWSWSWDASTAAAGSHTITARATDTSGNSTTTSESVTVATAGGGTTGGTSAPNTQGSWVSPEGVHINVNTAGSWTIAQIYSILKANALDLDKVGPDLTINVQDTYGTQTTASACCSSKYTSYKATMWLQGVNSGFSQRPDDAIAHEYGHAWSWYWYYLGHQGSWAGYLNARWTTSDGSSTLATDSRVGTSYTWTIPEIVADDYRLLFGDSAAISERPTHLNTTIPDPRNVPGLKDYLQNQYRSVS